MQYPSTFCLPVDPPTSIDQIDLFSTVLSQEVATGDEFRLGQGLIRLRKALVLDKDISKDWQKWRKAAMRSQDHVESRRKKLPVVEYPELPVSDRADEIKELIQNNQVVVIAGETGSGKTTQIPKICIEAGRGVRGLIGHTQPRRIAARTVAAVSYTHLTLPTIYSV